MEVPSSVYHGLLIVDKPLALSSMDLIRRVRRVVDAPRKGPGKLRVGHAGTLDPLATGVVILCFGKATQQVEKLMGLGKTYETTIDLSAFTATDDREGERQGVTIETSPTREQIDAALSRMIGEIEQRPPVFSAVHVDGKRAYKAARRGETLVMPIKRVRIDAMDVLGYDWPLLSLRIACGRGTYIRSIARDLGQALGTGGHLASLRRTAVGPHRVENAWTVERLEEGITPEDLISI